jgi:NitT/TauT family transport system ATP-binding protein
MHQPVVSIRELSVTFPGNQPKTVLNGIDLEVREGEFVAIVGHSGCGKTTLLNVVAGLVPASGGQVQVSGKGPRAGRGDICYLLARDALLPWRTVSRNVEFGLELSGVRAADRRAIATTILEEVGLGAFGGYYPSALSQGMRQRVSLARGFAVDRSVYLMDEPFSALDAETRLLLHGQLLQLWEKRRRVVLFVTHDIAEAVLLADRVLVLGAGGIVADIPIPLERPRAAEGLQGEDAFHALYRDVWRKLTQSRGEPSWERR